MARRVQIGEQRKGSFGETEDWWYFIVEDDGRCYVEHEWSHVDPYGKRKSSSGSTKIPAEDFLSGDYSEGMKTVVRKKLKK